MRILSLNASTPTIKQGEFNSSAVEILVPLDMRGYNLFLVFELPSGEKVFTPSILLDANNMISYALPAAVLSEIGRVQVELQGFVETSYIKSVTYSFTVVKSLTGPTNGSGSELKQVDYLPWFTEAARFKEEVETLTNAYKLDEALRISKEIARVTGESARIIAENNRATSENTRIVNEEIRVPSESGRVSSESGRVTAESGRVTAESGRVTAESGRVTAESGRVTAESGRAAALSLKADKLSATNLVVNPDFLSGIVGWSVLSSGTQTIDGDYIKLVTIAGDSTPGIGRQYNFVPGRKYYFRYSSILELESTDRIVFFGAVTKTVVALLVTPANTESVFSGIYACAESNVAYRLGKTLANTTTIKTFKMKRPIIIDLTAHFGAGNEPTKEEMDMYVSKYPNSWFKDTQDIFKLKDARNIIDWLVSNKPIVKPYAGVKWTAVGDSLTEKNIRATTVYHEYIASELGFSVTNMGVSGSGYKKDEGLSKAFYQRILSTPADSKVVTIFGSGNDLGLTLGEVTDTTTDTICGCMNKTIDNLYSVLPTVPLGIIAPTPWHETPPYTTNSMAAYVDKLEAICLRRGIPFLNLYRESGLRPWDAAYRTLMYSKDPIGNGTHPDENGHKLFAPLIREFVKTLV